jgi:hypothetical protein
VISGRRERAARGGSRARFICAARQPADPRAALSASRARHASCSMECKPEEPRHEERMFTLAAMIAGAP